MPDSNNCDDVRLNFENDPVDVWPLAEVDLPQISPEVFCFIRKGMAIRMELQEFKRPIKPFNPSITGSGCPLPSEPAQHRIDIVLCLV